MTIDMQNKHRFFNLKKDLRTGVRPTTNIFVIFDPGFSQILSAKNGKKKKKGRQIAKQI